MTIASAQENLLMESTVKPEAWRQLSKTVSHTAVVQVPIVGCPSQHPERSYTLSVEHAKLQLPRRRVIDQ